MKNRIRWVRGAALVLAVVALGACAETAQRASSARVVVEVDSENPVELLISTDFVMLFDENTGASLPFLNNRDSLFLTADYEEVYALDAQDPKFYAQLKNPSETPEAVHMRVFLDGQQAYDVTVTMANGGFLEYIYQFSSQPVIGR